MLVSFLGSGNVATHLAAAASASGHQIAQVFSPDPAHAQALASRFGAEAVSSIQALRPGAADIYILAVKDDAIAPLASRLDLGNALVVHTSGSVTMDVLSHASSSYGVLYAPQTFVRDVPMDYSDLRFCLEASSPESYSRLEQFARTISPHLYPLDSPQRCRLHLASVIINNFGNALNAMAQQMLDREDIPFEILHPLVLQTARKVSHGDLWAQQTGPAVRNDAQTIQKHLQMLSSYPELQQLYQLMTQIIQDAIH